MLHKETRCYDQFVVDSLLMHYWVPAATGADKAAAVQEMTRRGHRDEDIAAWLLMSVRNVARLRDTKVVPLPPIPVWTEQEWPLCSKGLHEMSPDNIYKRADRPSRWKGCLQCRDVSYRNNKWRKRIEQGSDTVVA